jgi:CrcB protein
LGAVARYGLAEVVPAPADGFPWATFLTNVSGCLLIGVVMTLVTEVLPGRGPARTRAGWTRAVRRLVRPFLGPGVLGGYTTFSTYAVEGERLLATGAPETAAAYVLGTLAAALAAVAAGIVMTRRLAGIRR